MNKSKVLTFFGSGNLAAQSLDYVSSNYSVGAVITKTKPSHHKDSAPVEVVAGKKNIPLFFANTTNELNHLFDNTNIPLQCGVLIDYGVLVDEEIIKKFVFGIVNSHFSLLPEWRGADPITFSILSGQSKTGVSLMLLDKGLDTGNLLAQKSIEIESIDDNQSLSEKLVSSSNKLLSETLNNYLSNSIKPYGQKSLPITYSKKILKLNGAINFNKPSSVLEREIRAYKGWPGSFFSLKALRLSVTRAEASNKKIEIGHVKITLPDKISIGCRVGSLKILELKPDGKKIMSVQAFLNGYSNKVI